VSVLIVVAAIAAARFGLQPAPKAGPTQQIVITPFAVHGDSRIAYLREGMVDLLVAKQDGAPGMHVIDPKAMLENLPRTGDINALDIGRGLARRFGAQHFITGTVVQGGEALQISATLYDAHGAVLARSDRVAANESFLFAAIDDLARELLAGLLKKSDAPLAELAALTTSSYPAVQKYLEGEQEFRAGAYNEAVAAFQGAVAQDSTFALAHYRLSSAADWAGQVEVAEQAARTAMDLRERLPKEPAALVSARWEFWFRDAQRADEIYRELTASRPTDVEAWFEQGEVAFHAGPWMGRSMTDAEPAFRRVLALDSTHIGAMMHLARVAALGHRVATLDTLLLKATRIDPQHERTLEIRALRAGALNNAAAMDSVVQRLSFLDNGNAINADAERVAVYTGNLAFAERIARLGAGAGRAKPERMIGLQSLAHLLAGQSRWNEAKQQIDILASLDPAIASQLRANLTALASVHATPADIARAQADLIAHPPSSPTDPRTDALGSAGGPRHFEQAWYEYQLGMLAARAHDPKADNYVALLRRSNPADTAHGVDTFRRSLAGSLEAHVRAIKGDSAGALRVLEETWLPARKPFMIGWAWTHANATDRLFRAQLLAHAGRNQDALRWCAAVREDIAGSPVLLAEAERVIQRVNASVQRPQP
jgi:TolB-like protein